MTLLRRPVTALTIGKHLFAGVVVFGTIANSAMASEPTADSAPRRNWAGLYVGIQAGGARASGNATTSDPCDPKFGCIPGVAFGSYNGVQPISYKLGSSGIIGGTVGYNWQGGSLVYGLEAESGYMKLSGSAVFVTASGAPAAGGDTIASTRVGGAYGLFAARLGVSLDQLLLYAKGGAVVTSLQNSVIDSCLSFPCGGAIINTSRGTTVVGGAIGGGIEYAFAPNWSVKGEYMWLGVGHTVSHSGTVGPVSTSVGTSISNDPDVHTLKIGLNYRFN